MTQTHNNINPISPIEYKTREFAKSKGFRIYVHGPLTYSTDRLLDGTEHSYNPQMRLDRLNYCVRTTGGSSVLRFTIYLNEYKNLDEVIGMANETMMSAMRINDWKEAYKHVLNRENGSEKIDDGEDDE